MTDSTEKPNYKKTLNLPATSFPMKANLVQHEPASLKRWAKQDLYQQVRQARRDAPPFVFHDGPPYANGDIHLGHLLNKVLKDFVVRSRTLMGFDCPFTPGWDCHGLPIEHKVMQDLGDKARDMEPIQIRRQCKKYAQKFVKTQKQQMQRLLTLADYDDPYLTMLPRYEAGVLEVFAGLIEKKLVYRDLKPVHWSVDNQTALAEAELEYEDREDTSVYVLFDRVDGDGSLMIWTTTPWTLPANLAVAIHERYDYGQYAAGDRKVILAVDLAQKVLAMGGIDSAVPLATFKGADLLGLAYRHPFIDRVGKVVHAPYVTLDDGTGLVHTAPGHGIEDYQTGLREQLDIYCPVLPDGRFDETAPDWLVGRSIWDSNDRVVEHLRQSGHLFHDHRFTHSYPHDWRGKKPVIFRATEQWFIHVDQSVPGGSQTLRNHALHATAHDVRFIPQWGQNRMRGMLDSRPDWCISRQRAWGLPIPAFFTPDGNVLLNPDSVRAVAKVFAEKGSDAWFTLTPRELLEHYDPGDLDLSTLTKGQDTFDVWFESGSSWNAVLRQGWRDQQAGDGFPAELYLEGSDQHRGWFQHSLLPALAITDHPPFHAVLTHGFMVDKDGKKMSKSLGNTLNVEDLLKQYGADVCRWWVSSLNTDNDIKVDPSFFKLAGEEYRKIRNTLRFLLSNLGDFDPNSPKVASQALDQWVLTELAQITRSVKNHYENYQFRKVHDCLFNFCNDTLSSVYLSAAKDRLYCDKADSPRRRSTQQALFEIVRQLCPLLAPILPHTADEAWRALGQPDDTVHLQVLKLDTKNVETTLPWDQLLSLRDAWLKALEQYRQSHDVDNPMDLGLQVGQAQAGDWLNQLDSTDLADLCGISQFHVVAGSEVAVLDLRDQPRCERSWKRDPTVRQRSNGSLLSDRDALALGLD